MEDRAERVLALVINLITNDWEQVSQIMIDLADWSPVLKISRAEVESALEELIRRGWACRSEPQPGMAPEFEEFNQPYFKVTPIGLTRIDQFPDEWFPDTDGR